MNIQEHVPGPSEIWEKIKTEAQKVALEEPLVASIMQTRILDRDSLCDSLAQILSIQLADQNLNVSQLHKLFLEIMEQNTWVTRFIAADLFAVYDRDPACLTYLEPFLFLKGFHALQTYRISHQLWKEGRKTLAFMLQSTCNRVFAVDIHPAAKMGHGIMVDHATALVIGETAVVGNDVSILHGVTLGGTGKDLGDRHPKVEDEVLLSAHSQLLGNIRIGKASKIGANSVVLRDVPAHTTYAGVPAKLISKPPCQHPSLNMRADFLEEE